MRETSVCIWLEQVLSLYISTQPQKIHSTKKTRKMVYREYKLHIFQEIMTCWFSIVYLIAWKFLFLCNAIKRKNLEISKVETIFCIYLSLWYNCFWLGPYLDTKMNIPIFIYINLFSVSTSVTLKTSHTSCQCPFIIPIPTIKTIKKLHISKVNHKVDSLLHFCIC